MSGVKQAGWGVGLVWGWAGVGPGVGPGSRGGQRGRGYVPNFAIKGELGRAGGLGARGQGQGKEEGGGHAPQVSLQLSGPSFSFQAPPSAVRPCKLGLGAWALLWQSPVLPVLNGR